MSVIDTLIVKLGLDSSDFEKGEKKVAGSLEKTRKVTERTGKSIAEDGKKGAEFFGQLQKSALKFFAVLTAGRGMADFTRTIIGTGAQLDRVSGRIDVSAETLSRWQGAVRQSGGTAEEFMGTVQGLSSSLTELKLTGNTGILPYLQALGISVADANGKAKPLDNLLADIGDKLNAMPNKADAFNIGKNLGIDDGTLNLMMKGNADRLRILSEQKAYSADDAKTAREAQEKWEATQVRLERTTQTLVIALVPAFEHLTDAMVQFTDAIAPFLQSPSNALGIEQGGEVSNAIGATTAHILALFGNKDAAAAVRANHPRRGAVAAPAATVTGGTRAERNNNPGNLEFRGQAGAVAEPGAGRFAKFDSPSAGVSALVRQLQRYESRGLDSISKIINKYAPSNENNTRAYIDSLSKRLGVDADQSLDLSNPETLSGLVRGISRHESGSDYLTNQDVMSGLQMAGINSNGGGGGGNMTIGEIKVYTQATDANGISRDIKGAMIRQADTGVR